MPRPRINPTTPPDAPVAPYRLSLGSYETSREAQHSAPYQKGDVVWVERRKGLPPVRAVILRVAPFRQDMRFGRVARFAHVVQLRWLVAALHSSGTRWNQTAFYTWPGYIQRGYIAAGADEPTDENGWSETIRNLYPHEVLLTQMPPSSEHGEFYQWLRESVGSPNVNWVASYGVVRFKDEKAAMLFKLRWS